MKTTLSAAALAAALALSACSHTSEPNAEVLGAATQKYLADRGDLCLGKSRWPIDVTQHDIDVGSRDARQMPALERLGLVASGVAEVDVDDEGTLHHMKVRRFDLTDAGRKFYIVHGTMNQGGKPVPAHDFCAAHLTLDKVVGWKLNGQGAQRQAVVSYTYQVEAAPWTQDSEIQQVFPVVAGVVHGAGKAQLQETFQWRDPQWVAVDQL
ncbi:hypothetical protein [Xylophilus rhododendri]|nr:hypothetical protein [Xylophilus rhododendri]